MKIKKIQLLLCAFLLLNGIRNFTDDAINADNNTIDTKDWKNEWKYYTNGRLSIEDQIKVDRIFMNNIDKTAEEVLKDYPSYKYQVFAASNMESFFIASAPEKMQNRIFKYLFDAKKKHPAYQYKDLLALVASGAVTDIYKWLGIIYGSVMIGQVFLAPILGPKFHRWYKKYLFKSDIKPEISTVKWDEITAFENIKKELKEVAVNIKKQKNTKKLEKNNHILFYGIPGNGKTFVAKGFASELDIPYFYISMAKLFEDKDSIELTFEKLSWYAKKYQTPIIVFIDEIDLIIPSRKQKSISAEEKQQLQNFLSAIDGQGSMEGVLLIVNTNYKDDLDDALLRDGRIGIHIAFNNPNKEDILKFFITFSKEFGITWSDELDSSYFVEKVTDSSVAKIRSIIKRMADHLIREEKTTILTNDILYRFFEK